MDPYSEFFSYSPLLVASIGSAAFLWFVLLFLIHEFKSEKIKGALFIIVSVVVLSVTGYLAAQTIHKNIYSETGGPVHWHADFEIFNCGDAVDLIDPTGLSNRIGTPLLHEHNDLRIHVEGVVRELSDVSLSKFFEVIGGGLETEKLVIPTEKGPLALATGNVCPNGKNGTLQAFLWKTENGIARQQKLADPAHYIPSPETLVPPGDCIIFELTPEIKEKTHYVCTQYKAADVRGDLTIEQ